MIKIEVNGRPAPQGSKNVNRHGAVYESSKAVRPWRQDVRTETQRVMRESGSDAVAGPVMVQITFRMPRPQSHYRTGANAHLLRESAPPYPVGKKDDIDKLTRAVLDGLTAGGAYADDGQVVMLEVRKVYATSVTGAEIHISEVIA